MQLIILIYLIVAVIVFAAEAISTKSLVATGLTLVAGALFLANT